MFRQRPAQKEDRQKVFEALRQTQETLDHVKAAFDAPSYPDEALVRGCDPRIGHQLAEFYAVLSQTHAVLTETVFGYTPDEFDQQVVDSEFPY